MRCPRTLDRFPSVSMVRPIAPLSRKVIICGAMMLFRGRVVYLQRFRLCGGTTGGASRYNACLCPITQPFSSDS
ncbi:hypothetical protein [Porphyromonas gingivicanis]|uniref:hypothetical protein n=1 Tax=Porphyromonas gingivicanis TaxID=266762 RepID=UPI000AE7A5EC|nr:hypothetical protein [Porphyromonas gingivicanis]